MVKHQEFFKLSSHQMENYLRQHGNAELMPIDSSEISVVVQGPVFSQTHNYAPEGITRQVLAAIRQHLPHATIILATWKNQPVEGLDADVVLQLDDPGTTSFYRVGAKADNLYNNGNRLIYSTQQGLSQVKTRYTLKIRSDLLMFHPLFSSYLHVLHHIDAPWQVLSQRIIGFPIYSLKFEKASQPFSLKKLLARAKPHIQPRPFHVSDWAYFGLTTDLKKLFDCPLMDEPNTSRWFEQRPKPTNDIWPDRLWRYSPEQYITSNLAERELGICLQHGSQDDPEILQNSERFIANNFIILDQYQWGLWSLKLQIYQDQLMPEVREGLYSHQVWYRDYQKYCVNTPNLVSA